MGFQVSAYSPYDVNMTIDGVTVDQFAEGTFIEFKYTAKSNSVKVGAKGDVTLIAIADNTGTCKITLKQSSKMHLYLTLANTGEKRTPGSLPQFGFEWSQGSTILGFGQGAVETPASRGFMGSSDGRDEPTCEWTFVMTSLSILG